MDMMKHTLLTAVMLLGVKKTAFCQLERIERLPDSAYVAHWQPVYTHVVASYVQLPGDAAEYKKIKVYVRYMPKYGITKEEEQLKWKDLSRKRYLGPVLKRSGRQFSSLLDDSVLGLENMNLRIEDQLFNNESLSVR